MKTNPKLYFTYKLVNRLLTRATKQELGSGISIRLNPMKFILNRTHYSYWIEGVEQVSVLVKHPVPLNKLKIIEVSLLSNINMILKCVDLDNYKEVKKIDVVVN
jgi:hypothetical protein